MKKKKNKRNKRSKKTFYEIFKIKKKNKKEKTIKIKVSETEKKPSKKQINKENIILRNFFLVVLGLIVLIVLTGIFMYKTNNFEHRGIKFQKVDEVAPYKTSFPVLYNGNVVPYNIYLRKDPRELERIEFDGEMNLIQDMVISSTVDFNCDGDGIIALANFVQFYELLGVNIFKNDTLSCDENDRYTFVNIQEGNETKIEQFGWSCYNININNCEILEGTERFLIDSFVEVNKLIKGN